MIFVAMSMKFTFSTFDTNGKLRDARRLHSMTLISLSLAISCMLNGPDMLSMRATSRAIFLMRRIVSTYIFCGGNTIVASPEWTPANSTCSEMA